MKEGFKSPPEPSFFYRGCSSCRQCFLSFSLEISLWDMQWYQYQLSFCSSPNSQFPKLLARSGHLCRTPEGTEEAALCCWQQVLAWPLGGEQNLVIVVSNVDRPSVLHQAGQEVLLQVLQLWCNRNLSKYSYGCALWTQPQDIISQPHSFALFLCNNDDS